MIYNREKYNQNFSFVKGSQANLTEDNGFTPVLNDPKEQIDINIDELKNIVKKRTEWMNDQKIN